MIIFTKKIKINGKEYKFNSDIRLGIMEAMETHSEDIRVIKLFIKEVLIPSPTSKEMFEFRKSDMIRLMEDYSEFQKEETIDFKKKLSR